MQGRVANEEFHVLQVIRDVFYFDFVQSSEFRPPVERGSDNRGDFLVGVRRWR
jgi:hypothetical protein